MNTSNRAVFVAASLVGSLVVHCVIACSGGKSTAASGGSAAVPDAHADTPPCAQWEVQSFPTPGFSYKNVNYTNSDGSSDVISMPTFQFQLDPGWEPIGASDFASVLARRCVK